MSKTKKPCGCLAVARCKAGPNCQISNTKMEFCTLHESAFDLFANLVRLHEILNILVKQQRINFLQSTELSIEWYLGQATCAIDKAKGATPTTLLITQEGAR